MKQILLVAVASLCAAMGFHSFSGTGRVYTYYWFAIATGANFDRTAAIPLMWNRNLAPGGPITTTTSPIAPVGPGLCTGGSYYCIVSFTSTQMTAGLQKINTVGYNAQLPATAAYSRN